jgi:hypothetical protein
MVIFSLAVTPAAHSLGAQAAATAICIVRTVDGLNLREGPGMNYPIKLALFERDPLTPQALSEDRQWMQVAWQPKTTGQPPLIGWVEISPDTLTCTILIAQLPVTPSPPTPSLPPKPIEPSPVASFEAGWAPFPGDLGEQHRFHASVIVPSEALIRDTVIFPGHMGFELRFNPDQNLDDSIIESVAITIFKGLDEHGAISVYHHIEYKAPYCAFGHTSDYCEPIWDFAGTNYYWPKSDSEQIKPGNIHIDPVSDYTAQMVMTLRDGTIGGEWDLHFRLQFRGAAVHRATLANTARNWTEIDNLLTNQNPNAILFVTQNGEFASTGQSYNHPIGVWYNNTTKKWGIYNQDHATAIPVGMIFNVLMIPTADLSVFIHRTTLANTTNNWTEIDNLFINGNPNAILLVTQNWNPSNDPKQYNNHAFGVRYNRTRRKWAIFNEAMDAMPVGAIFNVLMSRVTTPTVFVHRATVANTANNWTEIDNLFTNGNPNAMLLVTQNWNPGGGSGQANKHLIGVKYNKQTGRWAIFNPDKGTVPVGAAFNVVVVDNH